MKTRPLIRRLAALLLALPLAIPAWASGGGEEEPPAFSGLWGPVGPVAARLDGPLGVVEASWWRRPLLLAWLRMNSRPVPAGAAAAFSYAPPVYVETPTPAPFWVIDGQKIAADLALSPTPPHGIAEVPLGGDWDQFENCPADAWSQARRTLAERARAWGANSPAVRDWVAMQHRVFARCPLGPAHFLSELPGVRALQPDHVRNYLLPEMALTDAPAGSPPLLKQDRAYQRASALLYEGRYAQAESAFNAIAADGASPWQPWGRYLALRARLRALTLLATPMSRFELCDTAACQQQRRSLRERRVADGQRLRADVQQAIAQASGPARAAERERLQRLDTLVAARLDPGRRLRELAQALNRPGLTGEAFVAAVHDYLHLQRLQPPAEPMGEWLAGLVEGGDPTETPCPAPTSASTPASAIDREDAAQRECRRLRWSLVSLQRQAREPQAWAWLYSAAALARRGDPHLPALLKALAAVPPEQPAAASLQMERLRLAPREEVARLADELLQRPEVQADMSARNRVREVRMWHATSLPAFWADALREPGASQDRDTGLQGAAPARAEPGTWDRDAWWVLNHELPESVLLATARQAPWPAAPRARLAWAAFARAVLRRDAPAARLALPLLGPDERTATAPLAGLSDDRRFLREAALRVRRGAGLLAEGMAEGDCRLAVPAEAPVEKGRFARQLLNPTEQAQWRRERAALDALPDQDQLWMRAVLELAAAEPDDPRVPELLRDAVYVPRNNWCTAPEAGALSKQAFELLKRRYPRSEAARSTRYWFKPSS